MLPALQRIKENTVPLKEERNLNAKLQCYEGVSLESPKAFWSFQQENQALTNQFILMKLKICEPQTRRSNLGNDP